MSRTSLTVAVLVTGALILGPAVAGCATAEATPTVDVKVALVNSGGADPPSGEYTDLAVKCGDDLRDGRYADCENLAVAASASSDSQVVALSNAALLIAQTNQGEYDAAARTYQNFTRTVGDAHPSSQPVLQEYGYAAAAIAFAKKGDQAAADTALQAAQRAAPPERAAAIAAERCAAAPEAPSCSGSVLPTVPPTPTSTPTTPETSESPSPTGTPPSTSTPSPSESPERSGPGTRTT